MQLAYQYALYALCVLILLTGEGRMKRTVLTILAVMLAAWGLSPLWPSALYAWAMIAGDSIALVTICRHPASQWQSAIGMTYLLQAGVHFGRIIVGEESDIFGYFWGLSLLAILQLLLLGGWWSVGHFLRHRRGRRIAAFAHPRDAGVVR